MSKFVDGTPQEISIERSEEKIVVIVTYYKGTPPQAYQWRKR